MRAVSNSDIVVLYVGDGLAVATIRDAIVDVEGDHVLVGVTLSETQVLTHRSKGLSIPFHPMPHFTAVTARVTHNSFAADIVTVVLGGKRQSIIPLKCRQPLLIKQSFFRFFPSIHSLLRYQVRPPKSFESRRSRRIEILNRIIQGWDKTLRVHPHLVVCRKDHFLYPRGQ